MIPFDRLDVSEAAKLTSEEALRRFQNLGFLWIRQPPLSSSDDSGAATLSALLKIFENRPEALERKWSVENCGNFEQETDLSPSVVLAAAAANSPSSNETTTKDKIKTNCINNNINNNWNRFYVSTILSRRHDKESLQTLERDALQPYYFDTTPPLLGQSRHNGGTWLFLGRNCDTSITKKTQGEQQVSKKQKLALTNSSMAKPLIGRAEHVDEVMHSGTWHIQLAGSKTWYLRPNPDAHTWKDVSSDGVPNLRQYLPETARTENNNIPHVQVQQSDGGQVRLCCHVQQGDLFVLNTQAWYHRTELPVSHHLNSWSISMAKDFNLPEPPLICKDDVGEGEVILEEEDIPERFPRTTEQDEKPMEANCALAEVSLEGNKDGSNSVDGQEEEEDIETTIVLVALRDVRKGEPLVLQRGEEEEYESDDEDGDGMEEEDNAPESIDPRAIAKKAWEQGEIVLTGEEIPEELPISLDPNCQRYEKYGAECVRCLRPIAFGDVLTLAPEDGDDLDDYETVEVDLTSGEMQRHI